MKRNVIDLQVVEDQLRTLSPSGPKTIYLVNGEKREERILKAPVDLFLLSPELARLIMAGGHIEHAGKTLAWEN